MEQDKLIESIEKNKIFIFNAASYFCNRNLTWQDDHELNIAMIAFNRACESKEKIEGSFLGYCYILIKSSLIDYYIKLEKSPSFFFNFENKSFINLNDSLSDSEIEIDNKKRAKEIDLLNKELKNYSIKYKKLISLEFKDKDLRNKILNLVFTICKSEDLKNEILQQKKYNPEKLAGLSNNISKEDLKKYKNYILMLLIIISSEKYLYLKGYLDIKVGDSAA